MIVTVDIGNTSVSAAVYDRGTLKGVVKTRRPRSATASWWKKFIAKVCAGAGVTPAELAGSSICSVVPAATGKSTGVLRSLTGHRPLIVRGGLPLGLGIPYPEPDRLGPDRVCALLAAKRIYGAPVVIVDCGTAVTFDAVDRRGRHTGGMIAPGLAASASALADSTAALPRVRPGAPARAAGRSTREAVTAGVYYTVVGSIRENVGRLKGLTGGEPLVVGTGGDAELLDGTEHLFDVIDPTLVLEGAGIAYGIMARRAPSRRTGGRRSTASRRRAKR